MTKLRARLAATAIAGIAVAACAWTAPATAAPVTTASVAATPVTTAPADDDVFANCASEIFVRTRPDLATDDLMYTCPKSHSLRLACWLYGADGEEYYKVFTGIPFQEIGYVKSSYMNNETGGLFQC
ncbi:hypothetical protein OHA18_31785 [Kribbella sp. NBC_00709]|uniref:hypothetical protein n=1 Tax=Kribbella sp. NBC_00709 TaxID=2975972 RepID=UPI002E2C0E22|nr:hypothetical protein [Kribbella sp. NBC_00709]